MSQMEQTKKIQILVSLPSVNSMTLGKLTIQHAWEHTLPSVREPTLGKLCMLCRVSNGWHSANRPLEFCPLAPSFAVWRLWHSANALPSARRLTLGKARFADQACAESSLPSAALGKSFAECFWRFAECPRHSANRWNPVVSAAPLSFNWRWIHAKVDASKKIFF
jgi:hypothetical protein